MLRAIVLVFALGAAGCVGDPVSSQSVPPPSGVELPVEEEPVEAGRVNVTFLNGSVSGAGHPAAFHVAASGENVFEFHLPAGAAGLVVEVAWGTGDALDVQLDVPAASCEDVDPLGLLARCPSPEPQSSGTSPARFVLTDEASLAQVGAWRVGAWARAATVEVPFAVVISVFWGEAPEASYSGFTPASLSGAP